MPGRKENPETPSERKPSKPTGRPSGSENPPSKRSSSIRKSTEDPTERQTSLNSPDESPTYRKKSNKSIGSATRRQSSTHSRRLSQRPSTSKATKVPSKTQRTSLEQEANHSRVRTSGESEVLNVPDIDLPVEIKQEIQTKEHLSVFKDVTIELAKKPGALHLLGVKMIPFPANTEEDRLPLSMNFFKAKIRGHPDDAVFKHLKETEGIEYNTASEIIFRDGRVAEIAVPPEIMEIVKENLTKPEVCLCCIDGNYKLSSGLETDIRVQGKFLARVLLIEMLVHVPTLMWLAAQYYVPSLHAFLFNQMFINNLFIIVIYIIIIWGVLINDLGKDSPCNVILLVAKVFGSAQVAAVLTAIFERGIAYWRIQLLDLDNPTSLETVLATRKDTVHRHTYPLIVAIFITNVIVFEICLAFFFRFLKGNVKKDKMLWLVVVLLVLMITVELLLLKKLPVQTFNGPPDWNNIQIFVAGVSACTWILWRLVDLRRVMEGSKYELNESDYKFVALSFSSAVN